MAHFAELDENNVVTRVIVTDNNDPNGDEGYQWLIDNLGGTWIQTSYNKNFRKNFAGLGYTYDSTLDAFIPPKPFESWVLDEVTCTWQAPVQSPGDMIIWDEESGSWIATEPSQAQEV
jgi:hypothetical protein